MMVIEMREAAYEKAFELMDEVKQYGKKQKMVLCALEDALYECYEASKDEDEDWDSSNDEYEDRMDFDFPSDRDDMNYKYSHGMRNYRGMRRNERGYNKDVHMRRSMRNR